MSYPYPGREELQEADWDEAWAYFHRREERMMLDDFLTACQGVKGADVTDLDWLASVLHDLRASDWPDGPGSVDPEACWYALSRCEALLLGLRCAVEASKPVEAR